MFDQEEPFANPMAPVDHPPVSAVPEAKIQRQNLSNEDFRKLIMTPSASQVSSTLAFGARFSSKSHHSASVRGHRHQVIVTDEFKKPESTAAQSDKKKNKKKFYQQKKENDEENVLAELLKKYRDRAKERRENANEEEQVSTMGYNAVANMTSENAAERRKQLIEESKYLGGDMEHTHLVKGLDYALLNKVKAEIEFQRDQETLEMVENELEKRASDEDDDEINEEDWEIKSTLAKNLMKVLFDSKSLLPEKNDYFLPGRLAYVFDLENDCPSDAFTSVIRSKADCPSWESLNTLSTSEIVLNKLIEIFEELREQGGRRKKKLKQSDQSEDKNKFNFINQSCDFGTGSSVTGSVRGDLVGGIRSSTRSPDLVPNDLTSIYDNDLNVEVIRKQSAAKATIDIYDDLDGDYVLPHHREQSKARRRSGSPSAGSSRYSSKHDDDRHHRADRYHSSSRPERDSRERPGSSSKDRYRSSSSSDEERRRYDHRERDDYREHRRKDERSARKRERTPEDRHRHSGSRRKY